MLARGYPRPHAQLVVDPLPGAVEAPGSEVVVDGLPRREIAGQEPPGTTAFENVEDGIEDLAGAVGFRSSSLVGSRSMDLQIPSFGVG